MVDISQMVSRLLLVSFLSGIIGYERERHGRAAGLRTTILVGVGSCLIMLTSIYMFELYKGLASVDPGRIAAQVVSGIGFLGAGTIIRFKASISGLTTAAGLWAVSGVGLAVGCGLYSAALLTTAVIFVVLYFLSRWEERIRKEVYKTLTIEVEGGIKQLSEINNILNKLELPVTDWHLNTFEREEKFSLKMQLKICAPELVSQAQELLCKVRGVTSLKWI